MFVVAGALLVLFVVGGLTHAFDNLEPLAHGTSVGAEVLASFILLLAGDRKSTRLNSSHRL